MTPADLVIDALVGECAIQDDQAVAALAEAATYRELYLLALAGWQADKQRLDGATERLKQLAGLVAWHPDPQD